MSELPKGWEAVNLIDFIYSVSTGVPKFSGKRNYYSTGSINGKNHISEGEYSYDNRPSRANRIAMKDDVFQARMQGTDKSLLTQDSMTGQLFSTGFLQLRPIAKTYESKLLFYFIKSDYFLKQRDELATGSTQIALTDTNAINLKLIVPPLNEQRCIVAKLEKLLHKVDACKERLAKIPVILKRFRQSILAAACSGRLTADWRDQNPNLQDWKAEELSRVSERIQIGPFGTQLHKADYVSNGIPLINPTYIQGFKINHDSEFSVSKSKYKELENYVLQANDIIMGRRGEMGRCALISRKESGWLCGTGSLFIRPKSCAHPVFLFLILRNGETKTFLESESKGTTMNNLNLEILQRVPVPLPPLPEQQEIVRRVEALFALADQIEARYTKAKAYVDKLTQSILAKAFRGELVPQDPNDEPASVLLERIKSEKVKQESKKKVKKKQ